MAEPNTIYRVTILYMLKTVEFPLTNTQLANFFLEKEYTDYFTVQEIINSLLDSGLIECTATHNNKRYLLTEKGQETLPYFIDKLSDAIKADIKTYLIENSVRLKEENRAFAAFVPAEDGTFDVRCHIRDTKPLLDITINVKTKEQAQAVCVNWQKQNMNVYASLMDMLLQ